jgi:EAL domain-containing protein (putative c-di-GMP-specific phosphodiesterase class I)
VVLELHRRLSEPLVVGGFPVSVGVSIGAAHLPSDGPSAEELMRAADIAMYRSKRLGTAVERFQHDSGTIQTGRLGLLRDLSTAVRDNELRVDYQPQLSMVDGRIVAVEALVRWQHPEHGTIAPNDFIGLAEHTDLIGPITEAVMRVASGGLLMTGHAEARLAVNASVRNLQDPSFAPRTLQLLADTGFPAQRLELELTERALVTNPERTRDTIAELRTAGVRITVDGFGTGYASYHTLRTLNVDRIKIDRDFIVRILHDDNDRAIVRSVIGLAHTLGLEVIAEGVEANETWDLLAEMGCDAAQGFGIALPMPLASLGAWMAQWHRASTGSA